ncbi:MAG: lasso peptide biosynthesis B2 protein [Brevundimonas sp.]|nr:lasso peptide biosynthesis B2 protein [Brevundimonas sp.]MBJ7317176.1 lasso peptide biosynthesis B2 protein [Brevundimonas sp.]
MTAAVAVNDPHGAWLADGVHAVRIGADLVLLDLNLDDYLCLPECGDVEIAGRRAVGSTEALLRLAAENLLHPQDEAQDRPGPPSTPTRRLPPASAIRPGWRDLLTFGAIWCDAVRRRPTLLELHRRYTGRRGRRDDPQALAARVEVFRQLLPLAPWTGACLLQAELLLRFLNAADLDADWVFGVRTFPFLAHCWLQNGDHCVSEAPETLRVYRPILVI